MKRTKDARADTLVQRAYALESPQQALALYHDWAESYDRSMVDGLGYASPRRCVAALLAHLPDRQVAILDVGCGTGLAGAALAAEGCTNLHGIDFSPEMLAVAARRGIYAKLSEADLTRPLPMHDATYGAAVCTGTFTHGHVDAACLGELFRVLAPGAPFAFTVHLDVWQPMGFAGGIAALVEHGTATWVEHFRDGYYEDATEPEGHYCVLRKAGADRGRA